METRPMIHTSAVTKMAGTRTRYEVFAPDDHCRNESERKGVRSTLACRIPISDEVSLMISADTDAASSCNCGESGPTNNVIQLPISSGDTSRTSRMTIDC